MYLIAIIIALGLIWLVWEWITAPVVDDSGHIVSDPYNRTKGGRRE